MFDGILYIAALVLTFALTAVISHKLIPVLKSKKMGQKILEIGPRWHKSKEGTPTMGGIAFIVATVIVAVLACIAAALWGDIKTVLPFVYVLIGMFCRFGSALESLPVAVSACLKSV